MAFGRRHNQHERFFVARDLPESEPTPAEADGYVAGYRCWSLDEIRDSDHDFAPAKLAEVLPPVLEGDYPATPIDAGV